MPIYKVQVKGSEKSNIVKAPSAARARDHVVDCTALTAVQLADAIGDGAKIEEAAEQTADGEQATSEVETDQGDK